MVIGVLCLLFAVCCWLFDECCLSVVVCGLLFVVWSGVLLNVGNSLSFGVTVCVLNCVLFVVRFLMCVVCRVFCAACWCWLLLLVCCSLFVLRRSLIMVCCVKVRCLMFVACGMWYLICSLRCVG